MVVISHNKLRAHWEMPGREDSKGQLKAWLGVVESADWSSPMDVKASLGHASIVGNDRVVFNIAGNKYRLVALILYKTRTVYIRFVGTHKEYDCIDATTI